MVLKPIATQIAPRPAVEPQSPAVRKGGKR
jgi:hypothetical protein